MAALSDANASDAVANGLTAKTDKQPWKPPVWWGPIWAGVYALLFTPPMLIVLWLVFGYLGQLLEVEYWVFAQHTDFAWEILSLSPYCGGLLILFRFLPGHPLPMLKKIGFVLGFLVGAFWVFVPTVG